MSVTSATESFTDGAELFEQDKYRSTVAIDIEPDINDPHHMEHVFKRPLSDRIIPIHSHTQGVYGEFRLDDVRVRCPSEAFRRHQQHQWNNVKKEAEEKKTNWTYTAIGTGILASVAGFLTIREITDVEKYIGTAIANSPFAPILLIASLVGAVVSIIFVVNANSSITQANDQIAKWDADPVLKIGMERNEAHSKGFPYIYAHNLKLGQGPSYTGRLNPIHVEYEYKKYVESYSKKLLEQSNPEPTNWMNQFRYSNPFSLAAMSYGLGHVPEHMKPVIEDYTRFESFLSDIANSYDRMKSDVKATAKERIDHLTKTRDDLALPFAQVRDAGLATAKENRDRILRDLSSTEINRRDARDTFTIIEKALKDTYARSTTPNNNKYNAKIKETEKDRDQRIAKLDEQKSSQLGNNYRAARELLERAKMAWDNRGYQPVNFGQFFPYQNAQPVWINQQPAFIPPVQQQPVFYQPQQPVYQPPVQQGYYQQAPHIYPPIPQAVNPGYGQFGYGHAQQQIPAPQQYVWVQPTAPQPSAPVQPKAPYGG